jgi:subtilisin family serine protease
MSVRRPFDHPLSLTEPPSSLASAHDTVTVGSSTDPGDRAYFARPQTADMDDMEMSRCPARRFPTSRSRSCTAPAGAIAVIIYNNEPGNFAGTTIVVRHGIPVAAMSQEDGHALLEYVGDDRVSTIELELDWHDFVVIAGQVSGFSSRGPNNDFVLKPDVVAPGNNITAPVPRVGQLASIDGYGDASGISTASPHVAGALALLGEAHPDWTPQMKKIALMNTAAQLTNPETNDLYSVLDQGAGLIDTHAAVNIPALLGEAYEDHPVYDDGELARGSMSLGVVEVDRHTTVLRALKVMNAGRGERRRRRRGDHDGCRSHWTTGSSRATTRAGSSRPTARRPCGCRSTSAWKSARRGPPDRLRTPGHRTARATSTPRSKAGSSPDPVR